MGIHIKVRDVDICEKCGGDRIQCLESRNTKGIRKRKKVCIECGCRITTYEIDERDVDDINEELATMKSKISNFIEGLHMMERVVDDGE